MAAGCLQIKKRSALKTWCLKLVPKGALSKPLASNFEGGVGAYSPSTLPYTSAERFPSCFPDYWISKLRSFQETNKCFCSSTHDYMCVVASCTVWSPCTTPALAVPHVWSCPGSHLQMPNSPLSPPFPPPAGQRESLCRTSGPFCTHSQPTTITTWSFCDSVLFCVLIDFFACRWTSSSGKKLNYLPLRTFIFGAWLKYQEEQ